MVIITLHARRTGGSSLGTGDAYIKFRSTQSATNNLNDDAGTLSLLPGKALLASDGLPGLHWRKGTTYNYQSIEK
ncbi:hypothetical protein [Mucilaginibacter sp.]|uniref:hypothetical protein n=1 Tax=Mucilaginibacter sp. TaxID=1882438 RepID=UPI003561B760